jgi:uncharacterized protein involved in high-affinity Fe2+ transport
MYYEARTGGPGQGGHAHSGDVAKASQVKSQNHLVALITDVKTGEPVPYLPVSATIAITKQAARKLKLVPMLGGQGLHYGADVTLPLQAAKLTLSIGPTTMRVMPPAAGRFAKPQSVSVDWTPQPSASPGSSGNTPQHQGHGKHSGAKGH